MMNIKCKSCEKELKNIFVFGPVSTRCEMHPSYKLVCDNKECLWYGILRIDFEREAMHNSRDEVNKILDVIESKDERFRLVLGVILDLTHDVRAGNLKKFYIDDIYNLYEKMYDIAKMNVLMRKRICDIIFDMDMLGFVSMKAVSKGKHEDSWEIELAMSIGMSDEIWDVFYDGE